LLCPPAPSTAYGIRQQACVERAVCPQTLTAAEAHADNSLILLVGYFTDRVEAELVLASIQPDLLPGDDADLLQESRINRTMLAVVAQILLVRPGLAHLHHGRQHRSPLAPVRGPPSRDEAARVSIVIGQDISNLTFAVAVTPCQAS
jgi:hypothetical protein